MVTKSKKVQKTIYIDEDVWEALRKADEDDTEHECIGSGQ
jgi:oxalate decarboxylase/phosphoglucose isomerase-like protein (cupin superfamily)